MADTSVPSQLALDDNPDAPEIFVDAFSGFFRLNGNLRITFDAARTSHAANPPGPLTRRVVLRLVMPDPTVENLARQLVAYYDALRAQQQPPPVTAGPMTMQ